VGARKGAGRCCVRRGLAGRCAEEAGWGEPLSAHAQVAVARMRASTSREGERLLPWLTR